MDRFMCASLSCMRPIGASLSRYYYSRVGKGCQHLRHTNFLHWFNHPPRHQRSTSPGATVAPVDTVTTGANVSTPHTNASHDTSMWNIREPPSATSSTWNSQPPQSTAHGTAVAYSMEPQSPATTTRATPFLLPHAGEGWMPWMPWLLCLLPLLPYPC